MKEHPILLFLLGALVWLPCVVYGIRNLKRTGYSPHWMWFAIFGPLGALFIFIPSVILVLQKRPAEHVQEKTIGGRTAEGEVGKIYRGKVIAIKEFGCFVEFLPGQNGLCHISELANYTVKKTDDVVMLGDEIWVKCLGTDEKGRVRLSRKAAMSERERSVAETTQRGVNTSLQAESRNAAPEQNDAGQTVQQPPRPPPCLPSAPQESPEEKTWQRRRAESLYEEGAKMIQEGWEAKSKDTIADGLEKLQKSILVDAYFMDPWILTLKTLYRAFGRGRLEEMLEMQRLFTAPGEPEKTRILEEILDHLDETGSSPAFPDSSTETDDQSRKQAAVETLKASMALFQSGQKEKSDELLLKAVQLDPDYVEARIALTYACSEKGMHDEAISNGSHAVKLHPEYDDAKDALFTAYAGKGKRHFDLKQLKEAFDCLNSALVVKPDHENALNIFNLLWLTEASARREFIETCQRLLALDPRRNYVRLKLGRALMTAHRYSEALPVLVESFQRDQFNAEGQQWLCMAYLANRMTEKAKEHYELLKALSPEKAAAIHPIFALIDDATGDFGSELERFFGRN